MQSFFYFVLILTVKFVFCVTNVADWPFNPNFGPPGSIWIQIELTKQMYVTGIISQGRPGRFWNQFITSYNILYSDNGNDFIAIKKVIKMKWVN